MKPLGRENLRLVAPAGHFGARGEDRPADVRTALVHGPALHRLGHLLRLLPVPVPRPPRPRRALHAGQGPGDQVHRSVRAGGRGVPALRPLHAGVARLQERRAGPLEGAARAAGGRAVRLELPVSGQGRKVRQDGRLADRRRQSARPRSRGPGGQGRPGYREQPAHPRPPAGDRGHLQQGRNPQLQHSGAPGEAGHHPRPADPGLVRSHATRPLRARLRPALRPRPLPHARGRADRHTRGVRQVGCGERSAAAGSPRRRRARREEIGPFPNPGDDSMSVKQHTAATGNGHGHGNQDHGHHELHFWRKYIFSVDHKMIGIQYAVTALFFLLFGFSLMMIMRWQLAYPGQPLPIIDNLLGAMHGTIMVFLGVVPLAVGGFGNFVVPLQIGAPDMAFPRLNMASYWVFLPGCIAMVASFFLPGGAAQSGWTSYPPLADIAPTGQTMWLFAMVLIITSSLLGSINFIVTIVQMRAKGLSFWRLPFFVHAQLVTAFLLLLAFPPLEAASVMQIMDRVAGTSFFLPTGLVVSGELLKVSGGGNPLLWQHLFWFLAHPEVYVLVLPAMGIVAEVIANNTRKPLWGYRAMVYSVVFLGFMSFIVWAHHMFMTGMGTTMSAFFQTTTMIISIPSVVILTALLLSLWGASIRFTTPMLFALAFLPMFGIGGLTGLPLGLAPSDIHLHDTYYVIGHFHYVVAPGTIFALFAGIYYWFPKATGKKMNEVLGAVHFWGSFICINIVFMPMFIQGLAGMNRRMYDGGALYARNAGLPLKLNVVIGIAAWSL